jgi:hypothetical protein
MQLKRELQIAYDTAWTISHKIRKSMGDRDENYQLSGVVEMDEAFFGAKKEGGKRGRGTEKTPVAIGLSLNEKGNLVIHLTKVTPRSCGQDQSDGSRLSGDTHGVFEEAVE